MKKFLFAIIILMMAGQAIGATYYVVPGGAGVKDGTTWAKAFALPSNAITAGNTDVGGDGPHIIYIAPGTYDDYMAFTDTDWDNGVIKGVSVVGSTSLAAKGQVIITNAAQHVIRIQRTGITISGLALVSTNNAKSAVYIDGANNTLNDIWIYDTADRGINIVTGGTGFTGNRILIQGTLTDYPVVFGGDAGGTINYLVVSPSPTSGLNYDTCVINGGSGTVVLNNSNISGCGLYGVTNTSTGKTTVNNSILFGGNSTSGGYPAKQSAGTLNVNNSILVPSWRNIEGYTTGTVGDTDNIKTNYTGFIRRQRTGFLSINVDDTGSYEYAGQVADKLKSYGWKMTYYVNGKILAANLANVQTVLAKGNVEIGHHGWSGSQISVTGDVYSITSPAGQTIDVDRTTDIITITGVGTVASYKSKSVGTIETELEALGCTIGALNENLDQYALGEIMADSGGAQASPYTPQILETDITEGKFKSELADAKTFIEAQLGVTLYTFASPGGAISEAAKTAIKAAGLWSSRNGDVASQEWNLTSINLYELTYRGTKLIGGTEAATRANIRAWLEQISQEGLFLTILAHSIDEISLANWDILLDEISKYPDVSVLSMYDAVNTIKNGGTWTTADDITYTRTWTDLSNYKLRANSPALNAGTSICAAYTGTDFYGKTVCTGGNYMGRLNPEIGIADYPTVGQGTGGNLNLLWLGK